MTFQELIITLERFWAGKGCLIQQPYDLEVGAGTFNPATLLRVLGPEPWSVAYVEPSRRPTDGRYGENPNRLGHYYQYQVIIKPSPIDIQDIYLKSLKTLGIDPLDHDIRFLEDDWESPTLGASGLGWEVWLDGMEITQFTYFQLAGGIRLDPISVEITYGLERIAMYLQEKESVFDLLWNDTFTYGDVHRKGEWENSVQLYLREHLVVKELMNADVFPNPFSSQLQRFAGFAERRRDTGDHTGTMGNALVASAEKGERIFHLALDRLEQTVREYHTQPVREYREFGSHCP